MVSGCLVIEGQHERLFARHGGHKWIAKPTRSLSFWREAGHQSHHHTSRSTITMDASAVKVDSAEQHAGNGDTKINALLENAKSFSSHLKHKLALFMYLLF